MTIINSKVLLYGTYGAIVHFENGITLQDCNMIYPEPGIATFENGCVMMAGACSTFVEIWPGLAITKQPENASGCIGDTVKFSVQAEGDGRGYQWQVNTGNGWNNSNASSANTPEISFTVSAAHDGYQYRCKFIVGAGCLLSNAATLKVKPKITTQPANFTGEAGSTAKFTVAATGAGTLSYQWQVNTGSGWKDSGAASATTPELSFTVAASRDGYQYRCKVTSANGTSKTSSAATLTVK